MRLSQIFTSFVLVMILAISGLSLAGATSEPVVSSNSYATDVSTFTNPAAIAIPSSGAADVYPSSIMVEDVGEITDVTVTLWDFTHTWSTDPNVMLVAPSGANLVLMADVGGGMTGIDGDITISDAGVAFPDGAVGTGTYMPTDASFGCGTGDPFPAPAPAESGLTTLADAFAGLSGADANGYWDLYVFDDCGGDMGTIAGGWSLTVTSEVDDVDDTPASPGISVPNKGLIQIATWQTCPAYMSPGGEAIPGMLLPADADGNGFDTYVVTGSQVVDGETWVSIFIGSANWVWVPLDAVTPMTAMP